MHTVAANAYIAHRAVRDRIRDAVWPFELDPLCALVIRFVWVNGAWLLAEAIRNEFGLPPSTLSSALGRLEKRGHIRRHKNVIDGRYVVVTLTPGGRTIAPSVAEVINDLERSVSAAAGDGEPRGFDRVATILAIIAEEADAR
jgi:DNA-binding MarR family transcriptional regulator